MISLQRLPCAKTMIHECGCDCSADDYTSVKANITEMVPIRRLTMTLLHPFHHHRPHNCNSTSNPLHVTMRLVHHHRHIHLEGTFLGKEKALKHPHRSAPCGKAPHAGHHHFRFFSDDMRLWCRYQSRRKAQSQMMVLSICQLLTIVKPTVAHSPPRELVDMEWSQHGRELVMVVSIFVFLFNVSICHRAFRTFHPFPRTARVNSFLSSTHRHAVDRCLCHTLSVCSCRF